MYDRYMIECFGLTNRVRNTSQKHTQLKKKTENMRTERRKTRVPKKWGSLTFNKPNTLTLCTDQSGSCEEHRYHGLRRHPASSGPPPPSPCAPRSHLVRSPGHRKRLAWTRGRALGSKKPGTKTPMSHAQPARQVAQLVSLSSPYSYTAVLSISGHPGHASILFMRNNTACIQSEPRDPQRRLRSGHSTP